MEIQNKKFEDIISEILNIKVQVEGISSEFIQDEKRKNHIAEAIYTLKEYFQNQMFITKESGINFMEFNNDLYSVIDILSEIIVPSIKARNLINWWIYERDLNFLEEDENKKYLKAYYKSGEEIKLDTVEDLIELIEKVEIEEDFDFDLEVIKIPNLNNGE